MSGSIVLWNNGQSRNLALALSTVGAALVLLITQTRFELRRTTSHDFISAQYTVDRMTPSVTIFRADPTSARNECSVVDLEKMERELGVLRPWETLEEEK